MTPINTATKKPGNAIKVTNYPVSMVFTPNGKTAYVLTSAGGCGFGPSGPGTVTSVNTATDKPGTPIRFPKEIGSSAITPERQNRCPASRSVAVLANGPLSSVLDLICRRPDPLTTTEERPGLSPQEEDEENDDENDHQVPIPIHGMAPSLQCRLARDWERPAWGRCPVAARDAGGLSRPVPVCDVHRVAARDAVAAREAACRRTAAPAPRTIRRGRSKDKRLFELSRDRAIV